MQEIPFILTEWQELNSLLYTPLSGTKRIQYTCIAVSINYVVLGATSGSIYLFTREPCVFQQFIPLSEGAVFRVQISPDEKTIALATVRGSVCLIVLEPNVKVATVSTEHVGKKVTCLCWNDNSTEVYAGDETGKISVTILSTFVVNEMFQSPSYALMNLDSKIVQMNFASSLLLVSTLNRCYICNTVLEQYKQIGNKPRDGEFGACLLQTHSTNNKVPVDMKRQEYVSNVKQVFMTKEVNNRIDKECLPKIYCARPGSRLWEVTASGVVNKTHQFKEALAVAPLPIYKPSIGKVFKLKKQDQTWPVQSINFAKLFVISHKYLFSHTSNGLYVFDPQSGEVILWNDEFPDIFMAYIVGDKIYLMTSSGVFHCLNLTSVDSLILKLYDKKLYKECLEMCQILRPQIMNSIKESCDIDFKESADISEKLVPIISLIKFNCKTQPIKLEPGIVIVNAGNGNSRNESVTFSSNRIEAIEDIDETEDLLFHLISGSRSNSLSHKKFKETNHNTEKNDVENHSSDEVKKNGVGETKLDEASSLQTTICNVQADLETLYLSISSQMKPKITEKQLEEVIQLFVETLDNVKKKYEVSSKLQGYLFEVIRSAELHYCNSLLENLPIALLHTIENQELLKQLVKIFIDVNSSKYIDCVCNTPYPNFGTGTSNSVEPKFLEIGKVLLDKLSAIESDDTSLRVCNQITYMWRYFLSLKEYTKQHIPDTLLKQCFQTRDNLVLSTILPMLDTEQWKLAAQCLENIKNGRCVNCGKPYNSDQISSKDFAIDWIGVTHILLKKQGPSKVMEFLSSVNENLPHITFDKSIYQSIIFSTMLNHHGVKHPIEFDHSNVEQNSICSPQVLQEIVQAVEKDLEEPVNKSLFGSGPHHWGMRYNLSSSTCPCCTLSLQTPVLLGNNGIALFPCGHAYHVNCMIQKKISRCNLHAQ